MRSRSGRLLAVIALACAACVRPPPTATLPGCGKDTDCKGTRVCQFGRCIEPSRMSAITDGGTPSTDGEAPLSTLPAITLPGASPLFQVDWAHSGRSRFRAPTAQPIEIAHVKTGGVVFSSPAIADDGTAYFGSHDHSVYAAAPDGTVRWSHRTGDLVWCSPALAPGGLVLVGSDDDHLYALDAASGTVRWSYLAGPCRRALGVGPEGARCDVDGVTVGPSGAIYFVADGAYALTADGALKWRYPLRTHCAGSPAVGPSGNVFFGCQDGALYSLSPDGALRWQFRVGSDIDSAPTLAPDGTIYFGADDRKLYALTPSGTLRWAVQTGGDVRASPALGADGTIYVGSFDGGLYAVRADGTVAWTFRAADRILSSPLVDAAGLILFGSQDDRLYAVGGDGVLVWSVLLDGDVDGTPALGSDGTIYVGADDKSLHMLRAPDAPESDGERG